MFRPRGRSDSWSSSFPEGHSKERHLAPILFPARDAARVEPMSGAEGNLWAKVKVSLGGQLGLFVMRFI